MQFNSIQFHNAAQPPLHSNPNPSRAEQPKWRINSGSAIALGALQTALIHLTNSFSCGARQRGRKAPNSFVRWGARKNSNQKHPNELRLTIRFIHMRPNLGIVYTMLRISNLIPNKAEALFQTCSKWCHAIGKSSIPYWYIDSAPLTAVLLYILFIEVQGRERAAGMHLGGVDAGNCGWGRRRCRLEVCSAKRGEAIEASPDTAACHCHDHWMNAPPAPLRYQFSISLALYLPAETVCAWRLRGFGGWVRTSYFQLLRMINQNVALETIWESCWVKYVSAACEFTCVAVIIRATRRCVRDISCSCTWNCSETRHVLKMWKWCFSNKQSFWGWKLWFGRTNP